MSREFQINEIKLDVGEDVSVIPERIAERLGVDGTPWRVTRWEITRRSVDARYKRRIRFVYAVRCEAERKDGTDDGIGGGCESRPARGAVDPEKEGRANGRFDTRAESAYVIPSGLKEGVSPSFARSRPVVAGFGPCGIFAAYVLAKAGLRPIVLERGRPVEERRRHVAAFWTNGVLDEDSNVFFGEGGAGTFSDGKLTTGIGDPRKRFVTETFANFGGGEDLLRASRPHLGTDVLCEVVRNLREAILDAGGDIRFGCKLAGIGTDRDGGLATVVTERVYEESGGSFDEIETRRLVLAVGHSARDTMRILLSHGVAMEQKPFSVGIRVEHPQGLIDAGQYGRDFESIYGMNYRDAGLPPAEYKLSRRCADGRGVYTFCMCPGGRVIAAASEPGGVCTNGMSERARDGIRANSAILADVRPEDFGDAHPLAGFAFQRRIEQAAFAASGAGNGYVPIRETLDLFRSPESALARCLPAFVVRDIIEAMPAFGRK
ncbi:MAG: NAD(FAD)-utilizing dehydrogenase, partial [Clostridiales Family XIII bacterium]|nr:NAD(FAD)-utilizing dehydrogenase [Clostridiales Family XIII bacterium]